MIAGAGSAGTAQQIVTMWFLHFAPRLWASCVFRRKVPKNNKIVFGIFLADDMVK